MSQWQSLGAEIKLLRECVTVVSDRLTPADWPNGQFTLIKVAYEGKCLVERVRLGRNIKAKNMYRVRTGQMVFSIIRATDGAIGIVPGA